MNKELTREMQEFINKEITPMPEKALNILKKEIDIAAQDVYNFLTINTPKGETGGLVKSLQKKRSTQNQYYGYDIEYAGEDAEGVPYQKIANILNFGKKDGTLPAKYFLKRAQRRLKGLDDKINEKIGRL
jgi:hypothetical protein